ncbi:MAG: hypothetical protein ACOY3P_03045 [Planctomycetota bacterium]
MNIESFTADHFEQLAQTSEQRWVSLVMPAHVSGRDARQDPIRFKNLTQQAEARLISAGVAASDAHAQLEVLNELAEGRATWPRQGPGLAAFSTPNETRMFHVPITLPERVVLGKVPYLIPLVPVVSDDLRFFLLALSAREVRLVEGSRHRADELEMPGWPEDFEQFAAHIEAESQLQFQTKAQPIGDANLRAAVFHGHPGGQEAEERKLRLLEFFRHIDRRVREVIGGAGAPMILACDERVAPIYREASEYPDVAEEVVIGNPDGQKPDELCAKARELLEPRLEERRTRLLARYQQASVAGMAADRLEPILQAAHEGRVDTLLLKTEHERWGRYDPSRRRMELHDPPAEDDEELLNLAAIVSHHQGADFLVVRSDDLPEGEPAAAILRY